MASLILSDLVECDSCGRRMSNDSRELLRRARDSILLELRRRAYDRLPEPTALLLEIDAALGIEDHTWYSDPGGVVAEQYR